MNKQNLPKYLMRAGLIVAVVSRTVSAHKRRSARSYIELAASAATAVAAFIPEKERP